MTKAKIPAGYTPVLDIYKTQKAISFIKRTFQQKLSEALNLERVSAPLFVTGASGLNDNLNGVERPVTFDIPAVGADAEVVHSLAKWKRLAIKKYGFAVGEGIYTDMNAIRRDEELDNTHSIYVDQWDWEKAINEDDRTVEYLVSTVQLIVNAICDTSEALRREFPEIKVALNRSLSVISSEELLALYPSLSPDERENAYLKEHGTALVVGIGAPLSNGKPHGNRAPDYDDWALNADLLFYDETLGRALEISSMGIRVDPTSLDRQLTLAGCDARRELPFHKMLLAGELPLTMGGGIGQSRLCMLMIGASHIGEVQASVWDEETLALCAEHGVTLL
ncbi:MAG: aspartate--ammonia ligase [Clostridia bacterium]|nr:aspartate--ammonia ligase [Clostridia bacterium]